MRGAGFCMLAALLYHMQPVDQVQMAMFFKNFAIAGGFLTLFANGAGPVALDKARCPLGRGLMTPGLFFSPRLA